MVACQIFESTYCSRNKLTVSRNILAPACMTHVNLSIFRFSIVLQEFTNSVSETNENSVRLDFVNPLQNVASPQPSSTYSIFSSIAQATNGERQPDSIVTFEPLPRVLPNKYSNLRSSKQLLFENANDISLVGDWLG